MAGKTNEEIAAMIKGWNTIYPRQIAREATVAEGRRVNKATAVPEPTAAEVYQACSMLGLECAFEPRKVYPRDPLNPGRVRVQLKDESGKVAVASIPNKLELYKRVAATINAMPKRVERAAKEAAEAAVAAERAAKEAAASPADGGGGKKKKKKKGKK